MRSRPALKLILTCALGYAMADRAAVAAAPTAAQAKTDHLAANLLPHGFPNANRKKFRLNSGWRFYLGNPDAPHFAAELDDSKWKAISVPHTLKLTSIDLDGCQDDKSQRTFHRTVGWYRKSIPISDDPSKKIYVEFEGAHQVTDLWVNGEHAGQHSVSGYVPFHFDISALVHRGEKNQITLRVDNRVREDVPPDPGMFDYVKFSGLYRDLYLVETDPVHVTFDWEALDAGVFITTPVVDPVNGNAVVDIKTTVRNESGEAQLATVVSRVIDARGFVVLKLERAKLLPPGRDETFKQIGAIEDDLHLWSIENPYLYRVNTLVVVDGKPVDQRENRLGIRKFELDPVRGFLLNQQPIELIGCNRHQHYAYLGDALPDSLHYKDMLQFKQLGFNVVRTAHYPQDNALLDACDELGILVYEEAPTWIAVSQNPQWHRNLETALRVTIRNHRNHPSVVIWGAGINHRGYVPQTVLAAKQEDPTRLTASQNSRWTGWQTSGLTDIFANMMYGGGIWDRSEPLLAMEGGRGPKVVADYKRDPLKTGMISWTAHAYYTFHPSRNPNDRTRGGMMSAFRQPKRGLMWYAAELGEQPFLHIEGQWREGVELLTVYSNAEQVELSVNDKPLMKQGPSRLPEYEGLDHPPFLFATDRFEPGKLQARGFSSGDVVVSQEIHTPESPHRVELKMDASGRDFVADGSDILVGFAHVVDRNGTTLTDAQYDIHFTTSGPASVIGDDVDIGANPLMTRNGVSPVLIRAGEAPGKIFITAQAPGLEPDTVAVSTIPKNDDMILAQAEPIYDFEKIRVDIGADDQLVQFDWTSWNGVDNQSSEKRLDVFGGITASLSPGTDDGVLRWLGEMNVIGKYGFAYGEGVIALDPAGLILTLADLPEGVYKLKTWHHAPRSNTNSMDPNREKLKTLTIHQLPYAGELAISVDHAESTIELNSSVTEGEEMQSTPAAIAEFTFKSDGVHPVRVKFTDAKEEDGVWLNAFELSQWHEDLKR